MKKILNIMASLIIVVISCLTSVITIACSSPKIDSYVEMYAKYYNSDQNNPYYNYIIQAAQQINQSASGAENLKFDNYYDNGTTANIWNDYSSLQNDLIRKSLSDTVTLNINWNALYNQVGLSVDEKEHALGQQLRFYNIIAKIYGKDNVLKLLQWVRLANQEDGSIIAYNEYYPGVNSQTQTYGPYFANQALIDQQYRSGFWSTHQITSVSTHEYGHALSNFLGASATQRDRFNTTYIDINSYNQGLKANRNLISTKFTDRTQILINYLTSDANKKGVLTINDEVEKFLFAILTVTSGYSHIAWTDDNVNQRDEFFAEAFAYWLLTPELLRNVGWSLLNDFFIDYAPTYYNIQNINK